MLCHSSDVRKKDYRATCENIIAKLITDEDKYRFGNTKLFFRAGQVAYMEKLRSERLRDCGIMIQKHVKGWLYRKQYKKIQAANLVIQRYVRGFLARRRVRRMRRTHAAITIQRYVRGWVKRAQYQRLCARTTRLQAVIRGVLARRRHMAMLHNSKAVILQKHVRGWLQQQRYQRTLRQIVLIQSLVRRHLGKKELKMLKIEARSVEHQKKLNQGLENKIISLQQRLTDSERVNKEVKTLNESRSAMAKELETLRKAEKESKEAAKRTLSIEEELAKVKEELDRERSEKVDLVNEKEREAEEFKKKEVELSAEVESLREEIKSMSEHALAKGQVNSEEFQRRLEEERGTIHAEYEQERIAYQKLLKDYNRLEAQFENAQDELYQARGIERAPSSMSFASSFVGALEDESAYGSEANRSSIRSSDRAVRLDPVEFDLGEGNEAVGLTLKMQQKLKEAQRDKEKLEKRIEELESRRGSGAAGGSGGEKQTADLLRLQELEVENGKLQADLKKLREALADEAGGENSAQFKEVVGKIMPISRYYVWTT